MPSTLNGSSVDQDRLREIIEHLEKIDRPSASDGERVAAEWIAEQLRAEGATVRVEEESAHGGYWWPLGIPSALGALAGALVLKGFVRRVVGVAVGIFSAAAIYDDVSGGKLWFRRRFLKKRSTWNVVAEVGDPNAKETVVLIAHHDAAHSGIIFHPGIPETLNKIAPSVLEKSETSPPMLVPVFLAPLIVALGSLLGIRKLTKLGAWMCAAGTGVFLDIAARHVVPGANDNLSSVSLLVELARLQREKPVEGLRVILLSVGAEESFMEGMKAFGERHFDDLPLETTRFICLDGVGAPNLQLIEGEGMILMKDYDVEFRDTIANLAESNDIRLGRGLRLSNATDGLIPLKAGYTAALICAVTDLKQPTNYHWPNDDSRHVTYETIADATLLSDKVIRHLADQQRVTA